MDVTVRLLVPTHQQEYESEVLYFLGPPRIERRDRAELLDGLVPAPLP